MPKIFQTTTNNRAVFFKDGMLYRSEYLNLIKNSKHTIHLQTYIFMMDNFGRDVHLELINASLRGVKVYLLVDDVGSRLLDKISELALIDAGVFYLRFNEIRKNWINHWGRRLHHKILIVDSETCITGGINVFQGNVDHPQLDFALLLEGPVIMQLLIYCQNLFKKNYGKSIFFNSFNKMDTKQRRGEGVDLRILVNDWVYRRYLITKHYSNLTKKANKSITIINSYFFPRKTFMRQLIQAAQRGVRVRLILPKYSDWPSYVLGSEFLYAYFLNHGVEIYLWKDSILHGKMGVVDGNSTTIGSFNLNYTSYQQNLEMNINIYSKEFTEKVNEEIENNFLAACEKLNADDFKNNCSLKTKTLRLFYYMILSLIANFSIGFIYQKEGKDNKKEHKIFYFLRIVGAIFFFILGIIGSLLPVMPGVIFFLISFLFIYKQILSNKKKQ